MSVHLPSQPRHGLALGNVRTAPFIGFEPVVFNHGDAGTSVPHIGLPPPVSASLVRGSHSPVPIPPVLESQTHAGMPVKPL